MKTILTITAAALLISGAGYAREPDERISARLERRADQSNLAGSCRVAYFVATKSDGSRYVRKSVDCDE